MLMRVESLHGFNGILQNKLLRMLLKGIKYVKKEDRNTATVRADKSERKLKHDIDHHKNEKRERTAPHIDDAEPDDWGHLLEEETSRSKRTRRHSETEVTSKHNPHEKNSCFFAIHHKGHIHGDSGNFSAADLLRQKLRQGGPLPKKEEIVEREDFDALERIRVQNEILKMKKIEQGDNLSLNDMVMIEKLGGVDMDAVFATNILRLGDRYQGLESTTSGAWGNGDRAGIDEDGEVDMKLFTQSGSGGGKSGKDRGHMSSSSPSSNSKRAAEKIVVDSRKIAQLNERCSLCTKANDALTICKGQSTYLRLKQVSHKYIRNLVSYLVSCLLARLFDSLTIY